MEIYSEIYIYTDVRIYIYISLIVSILQQTWVKKCKQAAFPLPVAPYARMHTALQSASLRECQKQSPKVTADAS